jgi:hypothetical protein
VLKVTNRTHVVDNSGGGSVFLDVEVGNAEGCWVLEGDEVEVRVGVRNGCRGLWVGSCCSGVSVVLRRGKLTVGMIGSRQDRRVCSSSVGPSFIWVLITRPARTRWRRSSSFALTK